MRPGWGRKLGERKWGGAHHHTVLLAAALCVPLPHLSPSAHSSWQWQQGAWRCSEACRCGAWNMVYWAWWSWVDGWILEIFSNLNYYTVPRQLQSQTLFAHVDSCLVCHGMRCAWLWEKNERKVGKGTKRKEAREKINGYWEDHRVRIFSFFSTKRTVQGLMFSLVYCCYLLALPVSGLCPTLGLFSFQRSWLTCLSSKLCHNSALVCLFLSSCVYVTSKMLHGRQQRKTWPSLICFFVYTFPVENTAYSWLDLGVHYVC